MKVSSDIRFAVVPEWVVFHEGLSARAVRLYAVLDRFANESGHAKPSRKKLSEKMNCSVDTVDRALKELESAGAASIIPLDDAAGDPGLNGYVLRPQGAASVRPPLGKNAEGGSRKSADRTKKGFKSFAPSGRTPPQKLNGNPADYVGIFVDEYRKRGTEPPKEWLARVGKAVKSLLAEETDPEILAEAVRRSAQENRPGSVTYKVADIELERAGRRAR